MSTATLIAPQKTVEIATVTPEEGRANIITQAGKTVTTSTAMEALSVHGFDYTLVKEQLSTQPLGVDRLEVPYYAIVRRPVGQAPVCIGQPVSARYTVSQNSDIAELADAVAQNEGWRIDTMGDIKYGLEFFVSLDAGASVVNGESYKRYFIITDRRGGAGSSLTVAFTPVRLECANAINVGVGKATVRFLVKHARRFRSTLTFLAEASGQLHAAQVEVESNLNTLGRVTLKKRDLEALLTKTYGAAKHESPNELYAAVANDEETAKQRASADLTIRTNRDTTVHLFEAFGDRHPKLAGTAYAYLMAVTEFTDHLDSARANQTAISALLGRRAVMKERAYAAGLSLIAA